MLSVDDAVAAILSNQSVLNVESVFLSELCERIAAADVIARLTQPPFSASAMDGYAVRFQDAKKGATLKIIGEAPAGAPFSGNLNAEETVRIFTGGVVPDGADHIVIQENVTRIGDKIVIDEAQDHPAHIRVAGVDFKEGEGLAKAGDALHEIHGSIFAAANLSEIAVYRRPHVALFSNGDELMEPGVDLKPGQIINSNHYALSSMIKSWGGDVHYLGCAADNEASIKEYFESAKNADIIIPIGGASVGDYDYVKSAFCATGGEVIFEKVAVRPGKPTWYGSLGKTRVIGLPGNPASAIVTCALFVQPLVRRLAGTETARASNSMAANLTADLKENGVRETYLRGRCERTNGNLCVTPVTNQDSSFLAPFATANVLIKRRINAPAAPIGDEVEIVWLR